VSVSVEPVEGLVAVYDVNVTDATTLETEDESIMVS
jgi:hypothetical protein